MDKLETVIQILRNEGANPVITTHSSGDQVWREIHWADQSHDVCVIYEDDVVTEQNKIAWFQSSNNDRHLLCVYEDGHKFSWEPETYNRVFGCTCILLEWYMEYLLFIYQEKHDIYICAIREGNVRYFHFHGEKIERQGNLISYETFTDKPADKIRVIRIPDLEALPPMDKEEAEMLELIPAGLDRPGNFLGLK